MCDNNCKYKLLPDKMQIFRKIILTLHLTDSKIGFATPYIYIITSKTNQVMKRQLLLGATLALALSSSAQTKLLTDGQEEFQIPAEIYGQFAEHLGRCIYDGIWVGKNSSIPNQDGYRTDVFNALKDLQIPVLRWPGGCFADTYHWRDGIGPADKRPKIKNVFWGGTMEDNSFGTDEFFTLCERLGCKTYLSVNVGTGSVRDMTDWLEYITGTDDCPNVNLRKQNGREKPYKVDFMFMNLHMGNGIEFYYTYKTIVVNKGEPIQLFYQKNKGDYEIWYEYINGRHTGTFTIVKTKEKIFGTFKNSKGKTYKVSAHMTDTNYADE